MICVNKSQEAICSTEDQEYFHKTNSKKKERKDDKDGWFSLAQYELTWITLNSSRISFSVGKIALVREVSSIHYSAGHFHERVGGPSDVDLVTYFDGYGLHEEEIAFLGNFYFD